MNRRRHHVAPALCALLAALTGCVQQAHDRTVVYELEVSGQPGIRSVGVRGANLPLSWEQDLAMTAVTGDSVYRAVVTHKTGYLATEVKFTVNGGFELRDQPNRRVAFTGDTTVYRARFNVGKP